MFDIGFSEILLLAVVALLVVGPRELPGLVRTIGEWTGKTKRAFSSVRAEFEREMQKADEIQRLMAKEVEIAEAHKKLDEHRRVAPAAELGQTVTGSEPATTPVETAGGSKTGVANS